MDIDTIKKVSTKLLTGILAKKEILAKFLILEKDFQMTLITAFQELENFCIILKCAFE